MRKDDQVIYILKRDGLTRQHSLYPTYNYLHSLDLIKDSNKFKIINKE